MGLKEQLSATLLQPVGNMTLMRGTRILENDGLMKGHFMEDGVSLSLVLVSVLYGSFESIQKRPFDNDIDVCVCATFDLQSTASIVVDELQVPAYVRLGFRVNPAFVPFLEGMAWSHKYRCMLTDLQDDIFKLVVVDCLRRGRFSDGGPKEILGQLWGDDEIKLQI